MGFRQASHFSNILLKGLLSTLGSSAAGLGFAGLTVKDNLEEGKSYSVNVAIIYKLANGNMVKTSPSKSLEVSNVSISKMDHILYQLPYSM